MRVRITEIEYSHVLGSSSACIHKKGVQCNEIQIYLMFNLNSTHKISKFIHNKHNKISAGGSE